MLLLLLLFATKKLYKDDLRQMYDNIERRVQRVEKTALDNVIAVSSWSGMKRAMSFINHHQSEQD